MGWYGGDEVVGGLERVAKEVVADVVSYWLHTFASLCTSRYVLEHDP